MGRLEVDLGGAPREGVEGEQQLLLGGEQEDVRPAGLRGVEAGEGDGTAERDGHLHGGESGGGRSAEEAGEAQGRTSRKRGGQG